MEWRDLYSWWQTNTASQPVESRKVPVVLRGGPFSGFQTEYGGGAFIEMYYPLERINDRVRTEVYELVPELDGNRMVAIWRNTGSRLPPTERPTRNDT